LAPGAELLASASGAERAPARQADQATILSQT
jgi:hypothetical protein